MPDYTWPFVVVVAFALGWFVGWFRERRLTIAMLRESQREGLTLAEIVDALGKES